MSFLLPVSLVLAGLDLGGRVGAVFPSSGLELHHNSSARFGAFLGYSAGRSRYELAYAYAGLPGRQATPYRLDIQDIAASWSYEYLQRAGWSLDASTGASYSLLGRRTGAARERGRSPAARLGLGFAQRQGTSRLSIGLDNAVYIESAAGSGSIRLSYLFGIHAGVAYVF